MGFISQRDEFLPVYQWADIPITTSQYHQKLSLSSTAEWLILAPH